MTASERALLLLLTGVVDGMLRDRGLVPVCIPKTVPELRGQMQQLDATMVPADGLRQLLGHLAGRIRDETPPQQ